MCPCARSRGQGDARTGTDGGVRRLRLHVPIRAFLAFDLRRSRCLLTVAVFLVSPFWLGVLGAEGVGDALVGGISLPVDAVGEILSRTAMPCSIVPRKDAMLPEVMLRPPQSRVVGIAVDWLSGNGQQSHGWASQVKLVPG